MMRQSATGGDPEAKYVPRSLRPGGRPAPEPKPAPGAEPQGNAYRPPSMRDGSGAGGRSMATREDNAHTVRVTNLSEEITEQDLKDLFGAYGPLQRVFLARERTTRESKVSHMSPAHAPAPDPAPASAPAPTAQHCLGTAVGP